MRASNLVAAIPGTLPAAQIELRAIYAGDVRVILGLSERLLPQKGAAVEHMGQWCSDI
jgi:hypothetical protein